MTNELARLREEQMRIQALGAAISRRDWHAVEVAHAAIRDEFDRRGAPAPSEAEKPEAVHALVPTELSRDQAERLAYSWGYTVEEACDVYAHILDVASSPPPEAEKLKEALTPFAKLAERYDGSFYLPDDFVDDPVVRIGDLRRARAALGDAS